MVPYAASQRNARPTAISLKRSGSRFGNSMILIARSAAHANRSHHFPVFAKRNSARENHYPATVGSVDTEELTSRLRMRSKVFRGDIKGPGRVRLIDGYVDASNPRSIHSDMGNQVPAFIRYRNIHRLADLDGLLLCCQNNSFCVI